MQVLSAVEGEEVVDFVANDKAAWVLVNNRRDLFEFLFCENLACRVLRRVNDQDTRLFAHGRLERLEVDLPLVVLVEH